MPAAMQVEAEQVKQPLQLKAAPLSFEKLESTKAEHFTHVERVTHRDGTLIGELPMLNRKGRRQEAAIERRKFKPATRPMNQRELREDMLNRYEDSLYKPAHPQSRPRQPQVAKPANELPTLPLGNSRQNRLARRAEIRRRAEIENPSPQPEASPLRSTTHE